MKKTMMVLGVAMLAANGAMAEVAPEGSEWNPWKVGSPNVEDVTAYIDGTTLFVKGTGNMMGWSYADVEKRPWHNNKGDITSVVIGEGVRTVGVNAFLNFNSVTGITLPTSVTNIEVQAFLGCTQLKSVTIPASVTSIEQAAFSGCTKLGSVIMNSTTPPELGSTAFGSMYSGKICVPARCKEVYQSASGWSYYESNIVEIYLVTIAPTKYGTVTVEKSAYYKDESVMVTVTPDEGRMLTSLTYNDGADHNIIYWKQFWMPERDVTISAVFSWSTSGPWKVGEGVTASMTGTTLVITGNGAMKDFASIDDVPWGAVAKDVTAVTIETGVTKIGAKAWEGMEDTVTINGTTLSAIRLASTGFEPVIPENMVLVTKEAIQAPNVGLMKVENGEVMLGVSVGHTDDITADTAHWPSMSLKSAEISRSADNREIIIKIPVSAQSGFMLLKSSDKK